MAAKKKKKKPVKTSRKAKRAAPKKAARKAAAKKAPARKAVKAKKPVKKTKTKKPARRTIGEGNYQASKRFRTSEEAFVKKNKAKIPALAKAAEAALEGPDGDSLRAAETEAAGHAAV